MRLSLAVAALVILTPAHVIAEVTRMHVCERASITRIVELQSDGETGLPCRVVYKRPMEDQSVTSLWNAQSDADYCAQQYDAFIAKIENTHNWSCTVKLPDPAVAPAASNFQSTTPNTLTIPTSPTDSSLSTAGTSVEDSKESGTVASHVEIATPPPPGKSVKPLLTTPKLGSGLPLAESGQTSDTNLSMALIRQLIPSGQYVVDSEVPHSGNITLCPAGGFFIWSTKQPGRPAFEMGPDESFQFDLTKLTDEPLLANVNSVLNGQCHEEVAAGYCSNSLYTGLTPLHPQLSRYFGCGSSNGKTVLPRALVLFRSIVNQTDSTSACSSSPSPHHMALAPAGASMSTDDNMPAEGIELIILTNRSKNTASTRQDEAICRYIRG